MAVGYVLINVKPGEEFSVYEQVKDMDYVVDATILFGDYDIIIKLGAANLSIIAKTVVDTIRQLPGITDTKTLAGADV
ncbi:MAG: Lrp/AsnC ligand binding domain-containing protein [Candidatus Poseidoniales archaeon]|tara:strand:- start:232 stop:465 length:234 start_codon:yes stop_codon:yes gene_type:complete